jgi:hypothetical protein
VKGRSTTAMGAAGSPNACALRRESSTNPFAVNDTVGTPAFSSSTMSWTSHDVHAPQSLLVPITASHSEAMRETSEAVAMRMRPPTSPQ